MIQFALAAHSRCILESSQINDRKDQLLISACFNLFDRVKDIHSIANISRMMKRFEFILLNDGIHYHL